MRRTLPAPVQSTLHLVLILAAKTALGLPGSPATKTIEKSFTFSAAAKKLVVVTATLVSPSEKRKGSDWRITFQANLLWGESWKKK